MQTTSSATQSRSTRANLSTLTRRQCSPSQNEETYNDNPETTRGSAPPLPRPTRVTLSLRGPIHHRAHASPQEPLTRRAELPQSGHVSRPSSSQHTPPRARTRQQEHHDHRSRRSSQNVHMRARQPPRPPHRYPTTTGFTQTLPSIHTGLHQDVKRKPPHGEQVTTDFTDFTLSQRREACRDTYLHAWSETGRLSLAHTPPYERCKIRKICKIDTDSPVSRLETPNIILHFFASGVKSGNISVKSVVGGGG